MGRSYNSTKGKEISDICRRLGKLGVESRLCCTALDWYEKEWLKWNVRSRWLKLLHFNYLHLAFAFRSTLYFATLLSTHLCHIPLHFIWLRIVAYVYYCITVVGCCQMIACKCSVADFVERRCLAYNCKCIVICTKLCKVSCNTSPNQCIQLENTEDPWQIKV